MGKKYTVSQQKARAKQRAVTERVKREEAEAAARASAASAVQKPYLGEKEAITANANSATEENIQAEPGHIKQGEFSHSRDLELASDTESTIATPVTPVKDSVVRHLAAREGDVSADESVSEFAESEPADLSPGEDDSESCQKSQIHHEGDGRQDGEAAVIALPSEQPTGAEEPTDKADILSTGHSLDAAIGTTEETSSEVACQVTHKFEGSLGFSVSVPLHACSLLQAWSPKWVRAQVNVAVAAAINVTAAIAAVGEYREKM